MPLDVMLITEFQNIFSGSDRNYGQHVYNFTNEGKEKGSNKTITESLLGYEQYKDQINGKVGLGVIPINEDHKCKFTVIDIDVYDRDLNMFIEAIDNQNFPLVPFRSKSGGLHIYTFFKDFVNAKEAIEVTQSMVSALSLDMYMKKSVNRMVEIFPKQFKLQNGSVGNWINLPYYNASKSRQCVIQRGEDLPIEKAMVLIKSKTTTVENVRAFIKDLPFSDGPPCLQTIYMLNPLEQNDGRNEYLFSFGAYLKKKDENFFENKLFEINSTLRNPIDKDELERTVIASLRKKDYNYKCTQYPCVDYCNKAVCRTREYGVGKQDGYFSDVEYGQLTQIKTTQPYYEWLVKIQGDEKWAKLKFKSEDEIIKQDVFLRLCFRELHVLPIKLKQTEWVKIVNQSLNDIIIHVIDEDDETSPVTMFKALTLEFITGRARAYTKDQIFGRKVYYDKDRSEYLFRTKDLSDFLFLEKNMRFIQPAEVHSLLRDMDCSQKRIRTEAGKQLRVNIFKHRNIEKHSVIFEIDEQERFEPDFNISVDDYDEEAY